MQAMYEESEEAAENDSTNTNVFEMMSQMGILNDSDGEGLDIPDLNKFILPTGAIDNNMDYSPYPDKIMMLLDIMDNLPRLRLSTNHFKLVLWLLKQAGVQQVPSYDSFRKMQKELGSICGSEPIECKSSIGNHFYVNDPREAIKRQFANPEVAPHINFYPEETDGPISDVWQADRWREFDPSDLTPMYSINGKQFYINEVAMLRDNWLVIPLLWVKRHGELHADCQIIDIAQDRSWVLNTAIESIPACEFDANYLEIIESMPEKKIPWSDASSIPVMPNPKRSLVGEGEDLYVVMIPLWADDVSGNKSKHLNITSLNSYINAIHPRAVSLLTATTTKTSVASRYISLLTAKDVGHHRHWSLLATYSAPCYPLSMYPLATSLAPHYISLTTYPAPTIYIFCPYLGL
ncbi:hypothetical protein K435DRAFT_876543 [Dendrothele bispora CBS 962.96]|uniref:Uncharacterized protein n=1 Tax=Dendrothele bispora (strain CBS 962.96) TaxID=1314807 RepID=A0A4S8KRU1_DENBC|nr:hypothetical protein K435DRAFT_876543 [Dendrothele bispora CBS 962.96]